jgi:predicted TIM-barrel fold metal-dependent hydrolase
LNRKEKIAHSAMLVYRDACVEACKKYENIFVDTAASYTFEGAIEYMVSKVGAEKVLYGSDMAFYDCRQTLGKIGLAQISEEDKKKIFGENARRIFNRL